MTYRSARAFSLIELLVALAVFAALAAAAYGGLAQIARTRAALATQQDHFAKLVRGMTMIERDLRQAVSRPVRGNARTDNVPALIGAADRLEFTRLGFANPRAEPRSNLERVGYAIDARRFMRGRYPVLDRAPSTTATATSLFENVDALRLRYLGADNVWRDAWPPTEVPPNYPQNALVTEILPRAVELRVQTSDEGELRRVVELPSVIPDSANLGVGGGSRAIPPRPSGNGEASPP